MGLCGGRHLRGNDAYACARGLKPCEKGRNAGIGVNRIKADGFRKQVVAVHRFLYAILWNADYVAETYGERRADHGAQLRIRHGRKPHFLHHSARAGEDAGGGFNERAVKVEQNRLV